MLEENTKNDPIEIPFIITRQVKEMSSVCHALIETRDMGVIYGDPGVGKTMTASQMTQKWKEQGEPKVLYAEADICSTPFRVANKLLQGMANLRPADTTSAIQAIENLSQEQEFKLMILDEAERLNRKCLEMVRSIYDRTKIPILLIGMTDILRSLRSHKKFYSRIAVSYHYEPLSYQQLAEYLAGLHPLLKDIDAVLEKELLHLIFQASKGEFRRVIQLVKQAERVRKVNNHPVLSLSVFEAASKLLLKIN